ncbi:Rhodanese- sulfurtransferase, partial [Dispira parvispora]
DGAQLLVNSIFALPTTTEDEAVIAQLPKPKLVLPREKHVPKPKPMTRWERFAQAKGIQNRKKSRLVYDEATDEYLPRWGYKGVNNKEKDWLIELKDNDDPFEDQYQKRRDEKKGRVAKDQRRQQRNAEEAAAKEKLGVENPRALRKADLQRALAVTKSSTASVGKFDPKLEGEPKIKGVKRKFQSATISSKDEKDTAMKLLNKVTGNKRTDVNARKAMKKLKQ